MEVSLFSPFPYMQCLREAWQSVWPICPFRHRVSASAGFGQRQASALAVCLPLTVLRIASEQLLLPSTDARHESTNSHSRKEPCTPIPFSPFNFRVRWVGQLSPEPSGTVVALVLPVTFPSMLVGSVTFLIPRADPSHLYT